ncbi:hypothetical protein CCHR01_02818 [Colletotrichum chrysophilum]|uniref:Uncharacterized protein n=1 Tax=Colletotrichum chrysophilum TaxID=1836956 RepID=A0AAD9AWB6_9PEZI|nr:hypothetical protein CCHR01_02818 [Colletotrichum chrysophilum]
MKASMQALAGGGGIPPAVSSIGRRTQFPVRDMDSSQLDCLLAGRCPKERCDGRSRIGISTGDPRVLTSQSRPLIRSPWPQSLNTDESQVLNKVMAQSGSRAGIAPGPCSATRPHQHRNSPDFQSVKTVTHSRSADNSRCIPGSSITPTHTTGGAILLPTPPWRLPGAHLNVAPPLAGRFETDEQDGQGRRPVSQANHRQRLYRKTPLSPVFQSNAKTVSDEKS